VSFWLNNFDYSMTICQVLGSCGVVGQNECEWWIWKDVNGTAQLYVLTWNMCLARLREPWACSA